MNEFVAGTLIAGILATGIFIAGTLTAGGLDAGVFIAGGLDADEFDMNEFVRTFLTVLALTGRGSFRLI